MMKLRALATVLCFSMGCAFAENFREPDTGLRFPEKLGEWVQSRVTTFPQPALGVSISYKLKNGHTLTLYVYSKGYPSVPSGGGSSLMIAEMVEVAATIEPAWKQRGATVKPLMVGHQVNDSACPGTFALVSAHQITMPTSVLFSISGLTGYRNRILKLRYTYAEGDVDSGFKATGEFLRELIKENTDGLDPFFECVVRENYPELKDKPDKAL